MNAPSFFPRSGARRAAVCLFAACLAAPLFADDMMDSATKPDAEKPVPPSVLREFDKNKDGVLDEQERAKWETKNAVRREKYAKERAEMLEKFDADKNGKISEEERAAARLAMSRNRTEADVAKAKEKDVALKAEKEAREAAEKATAEKAAADAKAAEAAKTNARKPAAPAAGDDMMSGGTMSGESMSGDPMMMQ